MAADANELRQCSARHGQRMTLQCQGEVTALTTHLGDHWAFEPDGSGNKIFWTEVIAMYPIAGPDTARASQVAGDHYRKFKIQPWDIWQEYELDAFAGTVLKYLLRAGHKGNKLEDLKKARHTLDRLIEIEEARGGRPGDH